MPPDRAPALPHTPTHHSIYSYETMQRKSDEHWAIPDKNCTPPRKTNRLSAVVSFDTGNIQGVFRGGVQFLSACVPRSYLG